MLLRARQRGLTLWGFVFVAAVVLVVALIAFTGLPGLGSSRYPLHYAALPPDVVAKVEAKLRALHNAGQPLLPSS